MPTRKNVTEQHRAKKMIASSAPARTSNRKTPGTRVGTLEDWREGGKKRSTARRNQLRDGS